MRVAAVAWCMLIPGLQVYLFRRIREDLIKNHVEGPKGLRTMLAPLVVAGVAKIVEDEIRFANGSKIYLCHCKDEKDRFKYLGAEIHVLLIDELTTFTDVIYRFLRGRVRAVGLDLSPKYAGTFPRILASTNPGNIGHQWVKRTFIDSHEPGSIFQTSDDEGGMLRQFIQAKLDDNPSMAQDDPSYRQRLRGLGNPALVRAMEEGDWDIIAGAFFPEFSADKHIIKPFSIPMGWTRFRAMDWGSRKPFSVGWYAVSDGTLDLPRGALVKYREWYGCTKDSSGGSIPDTGLMLTADKVGDGIKSREQEKECHYGVADPSMWKVDGGPSIAERMIVKGVTWRKADNSRINGWDQLRARLEGEDDEPMLYFFPTCLDTFRTLPALQHDPDKAEDLETDSEDHAADELRYACMSRPYQRGTNKPKPGPKPGTFAHMMKITDDKPDQPSRYRLR